MFEKNHIIPVLIIIFVGIAAAQFILDIPSECNPLETERSTIMSLPAVDDDGNGVLVKLKVGALEGSGRILANIDKMVFWADTQESIQIARDVSAEITGIDASKIDIIYTILNNDNETGIVGGPSAGAAIAIATIFAIENKQINENVVITGGLDRNGTIESVGGILEKASAAKKAGATLFIVPKGQSQEDSFGPVEECIEKDDMQYCETDYKKKIIIISQEIGIEVKEVSNIREALEYF